MHNFLRSRHFIVLLCVLLLAAKISGAHWHLCLDGSEPPQSMHMSDLDLHADESAHEHQDVDLKLVGEALAKNVGNGLDAPMLLACFALLWLFQFSPRSLWRAPRRELLFVASVFPPHAPPRAPPR